jgi:hypothetical protein
MTRKYTKHTTENFIKESQKIYKDKFDYSNAVFVNCKTKIELKCKDCGNIVYVLSQNHLKNRKNIVGCKFCQYKILPQNKPISHKQFLRRARKIHNNKYEYLSKYINSKVKIKIECNDCGNTFEQMPHSHLDGCGCPKCQYSNLPQNKPMDITIFESRCKKMHDNRYVYNQDYKGLRYKIKIYCKKHKEYFFQEANAHLLKGQGCPRCCLSKGEIIIEKYLKSHGVKYEYEKRFDDCKNKQRLSFDFYIPELYICIEYDGQQHFYPVKYFGGKRKFLITKKHDKIKTDYCKKNNIKLLRIPFYEINNIEKILSKNKIISLSPN